MAAATVIGGLALAAGAVKAIDGSNRSKNAKNELDAYQRQGLDNAFKNISISTMGSDLMKEQGGLTSAGLIDASAQAGTRAIIGGVPRIMSGVNGINQDAAKMLDDQFLRREYAIAGDEVRIEQMTENRDNNNIAALSSQVDAGNEDMWDGVMGGLSAAGSLSRSIGSLKTEDDGETAGRKQIESVNLLKPAVLAPSKNLGAEFSSSFPYNRDSLNWGSKMPKYGGKYLTR